jgi:hypothetical protein
MPRKSGVRLRLATESIDSAANPPRSAAIPKYVRHGADPLDDVAVNRQFATNARWGAVMRITP